MKDLADQLTNATSRTFSALGYDPAYATVKLADRRDLADFQCNGALALAKKVGRKPQEIAAAVAQAWTATDIADRPTVAGPGFLNFRLTAGAMSARAQQIADDPRAGAAAVSEKRRVVIDYGGPQGAEPPRLCPPRSAIFCGGPNSSFSFFGVPVGGGAAFAPW